MQPAPQKRKTRKLLQAFAVVFSILLVGLVLFANRYLSSMLRSRLHTLIVQGSDSLYYYSLGNLKANVIGGRVAVENLHIKIDSSRYRRMMASNTLPSLTMELHLQEGHIAGLNVLAVLFRRKIAIDEIGSAAANVRLTRHVKTKDAYNNPPPLWKRLQPSINGIYIRTIGLDSVKMLYRDADTSEAIKLQFDHCKARFNDVQVDSAAAADTGRIAFTKDITLRFSDLKFRTPDSAYKMKAETIVYNSKQRFMECTGFKLQPTIKDKEAFYNSRFRRSSRYEIAFAKTYFTNLRLDQFVDENIIRADSMVMQQPEIDIYSDKVLFTDYVNKYGTYPHQKLLRASMAIDVKAIRIKDGTLRNTERAKRSGREGTLAFSHLNAIIANVTNLPALIKQNSVCTASMQARIFDTSPLQAQFLFHLDSAEGEFSIKGQAQNITAAQLNTVAVPLGNTELQSGIIHHVDFDLRGDEYTGSAMVNMRYNNLSILLRKRDEETGALGTKKFLTKLLNQFTLYPDNPGPDAVLRKGRPVRYSRPSSKSFFGAVWKMLLAGMQQVMLKSGAYE